MKIHSYEDDFWFNHCTDKQCEQLLISNILTEILFRIVQSTQFRNPLQNLFEFPSP
jgi:hypothetical protein